MNKKLLVASLLFVFFCRAWGYASEDSDEYLAARNNMRSGKSDFAFMHLISITRSKAKSRYQERALFETGEYYFRRADYYDASRVLKKLIESYPDSKIRPFALFYLLKIAQYQNNKALTEAVKNEIINYKQVVLVFKDTKEFRFRSIFGKRYRLIYHIDKIELFEDEKLFAQISY
ncbi:MAG: hypothetical protein JW788_04925 [Candidatus Omnitrophica bacterium]|nr:hypothetical protein [Candidatus Omnitrophota bacterium]